MSRALLLFAPILLLSSACERRRETPAAKPVAKPRPTLPARKAPLPRRAIPSLLPEQGPHPDYPTPLAAGTDKLFFLEEPERGPQAPLTTPSVADRAALRLTYHLHCEPHLLGVSCGAPFPTPPAPGPHWRLGRRGKQLVLAQALHARAAKPRASILFPGEASGMDRIVILDARGGVSEARFCDRARRRCSGRKLSGGNALSGCGQLRYELDAQGRPIELGCLQWLGEPMLDADGVASTRFKLDRAGFILERSRFGLDGKPIAGHDGIHQTRFERDPAGRVLSERGFDLEGRPVRWNGCHGHRNRLDTLGRIERRVCLDLEGNPSKEIVTEHSRYDARGCLISTRRFLGEERARGTANVHGIDYEVDEACDTLSMTCLNLLEQPLPCGPGEPPRYRYARDARGQIISTQHLGPGGKPASDKSYGIYELRSQLDSRGNATGQSCHDAEARPVLCGSTGFHALLWRRDEVGRAIEERFLGIDGAPTSNLGCHVRRFQYDNYDHLFESRNHDEKGALTEVMGAAIRRELYDSGHRKFAVLILDRNAKPARYTGCYSGVDCPRGTWHAVRIVRAPAGSVVKNQYFDHAGQLIHTLRCDRHRCWK